MDEAQLLDLCSKPLYPATWPPAQTQRASERHGFGGTASQCLDLHAQPHPGISARQLENTNSG